MDNQNVTDVAVGDGAVGGILSTEIIEETEDKNFRCEPCIFDSAEVKATAFCIDCFEHLCNSCARDHRRNKMLRNHKLLEGAEIPKDLKAIKALKWMMTCSDHPETDVTYKCEDHDKYVCVTCLAECHRKCSEVNEISKVARSGTEDLCSIVKETLSQLQEYTVASKTASEENIQSLRLQHSAVQKEQQSVFDSIYEQLAQKKQELELETDALMVKELNDVERKVQKFKEAEKEEQEYQRLLDVTLKFGNAKEANVIPDLISRKAKVLKEALETKYRKERTNIKFTCSLDLNTLTDIGQVSLMYSEQVKEADPNVEHRLSSDVLLQPENVSYDMMKLNAESSSPQCRATKYDDTKQEQLVHTNLSKQKCERSTRNTEDRSSPFSFMKRSVTQNAIPYTARYADDTYPCNIYSIVILPDERLVLIDKANMKLKVFEEDFSLAYTFGFMDEPFDMCHVNDETVAVAITGTNSVEIYCIGQSQISRTRKFPTKFAIVALGKFGNDREIAVLFSDKNSAPSKRIFIQIRDTENGRILETFYFEKSMGVTFNFEDVGVNRILSRGTNEIFVSDFSQFNCFLIDKSNRYDCNYIQESWFYKNRTGSVLNDISDLAADEEGNIYVCGCGSDNMHQISADNYRENRIIITDIKKPLSLSVNSKKGYLVVACKEDDYIHVYHFR